MQNSYDLWMKWNDRLRLARDAAKLKNTDIARALKVSDPTVNGWITGKTVNIEARYLLPLCKLLRVSPFWIMFEDETETEIAEMSAYTALPAVELIRLISIYAQASDDSRRRILELASTIVRPPSS